MPSLRRSAVFAFLALGALLLTGDLAAQERRLEIGPEQAERFHAARSSFAAADAALGTKRWDDAVAAYAEAVEALGDDAVLGGLRDNALYNTACAHARAGRADAAATAFAASVEHGIRLLVAPAGDRWAAVRGLTVTHVLHDPDLDSIRRHPGYLDALHGLVRASRVAATDVGAAEGAAEGEGGLRSVVLVLSDGRTRIEDLLALWRDAAEGRHLRIAVCSPPIRVLEDARAWVLEDGDERFGVATIAAVRERLGTPDGTVDGRVYLAAASPLAGQAAWAAWLADPGAFEGVMLRGARFHAHWHADAIATLDAAAHGRVVLGPADDRAASLLTAAGLTPTRISRGTDALDAARTALATWLD